MMEHSGAETGAEAAVREPGRFAVALKKSHAVADSRTSCVLGGVPHRRFADVYPDREPCTGLYGANRLRAIATRVVEECGSAMGRPFREPRIHVARNDRSRLIKPVILRGVLLFNATTSTEIYTLSLRSSD